MGDFKNGRHRNAIVGRIDRTRELLAADKIIQARTQLNALLSRNLVESEAVEVRGLLVQIADDTIFGRRRVPGDPLVYYFGSTGGGVWKTSDGGRAWKPVSGQEIRC